MSVNRRRFLYCFLVAVPTAVLLALAFLPPPEGSEDAAGERTAPQLAELKALLETRKELDKTLWAPEQVAIAHENTFIRLWDSLRASTDLSTVLASFDFGTVTIGKPNAGRDLDPGMTEHALDRELTEMPADSFRRLVTQWRTRGYELGQSEWHHESFQRAGDGQHTSIIQVALHIQSPSRQERVQIKGPLVVTWSGRSTGDFPIPAHIDASSLTLRKRTGADAFREELRLDLGVIDSEATHDDILASDLDGDGVLELAHPKSNTLLRRTNGTYKRELLCKSKLSGVCEGLLVDFTADGNMDLICAGINAAGTGRDIYVYEGGAPGSSFTTSPRPLTAPELEVVSPDSIAVGDVDADGDLDLFVTQYHAPYRDGKMPSPYYDANDGLPAYLLLNDGKGRLRDATADRGLAEKRYRRAYRSSLVDLDNDQDLDLLVTSDFSGIDLYENDGRGFFRDVTKTWVRERSLFGMSHIISDFNGDGRLDIYATGMASTTARRLAALGLSRDDFPEDAHRRSRLAYGNRLYFQQAGPKYLEGPASVGVARAGWSWGCAALDFENDGDVDIYVANGHLSGESAADYCTRFWCHDIYEGHTGTPGFATLAQINSLQLGTKESWNGYEKNRLFLNQDDASFVDVAFLMDTAIEEDSRSVLAEDFNGDGRTDLVVGYADRRAHPPRYVARLLVNDWSSDHHWIGVRLAGPPNARTIGATVFVHTPTGVKADTMISGESFASQQSASIHFGLGASEEVSRLEIRWPGGKTTKVEDPAVDRYHAVNPP